MKKGTLRVTLTVTLIALICLVLDAVRRIYLGSGCLFKALIGIPCPACGMTRAYTALLSLDPAKAFYYAPGWWTVPIAVLLGFLALFDKKRARLYLKIFAIDIAAVLVIWIIRLATGTAV